MSYSTLKTTWVKQQKYTFSADNSKENFGAFSISAAVRGGCSACWDNPWYRGYSPDRFIGVM